MSNCSVAQSLRVWGHSQTTWVQVLLFHFLKLTLERLLGLYNAAHLKNWDTKISSLLQLVRIKVEKPAHIKAVKGCWPLGLPPGGGEESQGFPVEAQAQSQMRGLGPLNQQGGRGSWMLLERPRIPRP